MGWRICERVAMRGAVSLVGPMSALADASECDCMAVFHRARPGILEDFPEECPDRQCDVRDGVAWRI